ncbi:class I SAM-dependent methyltransferase [Azohydromonas australica]|uniref:class I SAM-dependent methyltransferase n=1 Tax=Azohydromonas australica TaxID=364039 RepID=UPI000422C2F4|nr:class I SAM-dependent methyltransferase [Azohydromonas australica]
MDASGTDRLFAGSIPDLYDRCVVPLIFQGYAADLARRVAMLRPARVLETAAGTGVVTRALAQALPTAELVATDLNPPMLERARAVGAAVPVRWQPADAQSLPFDDASFDAVVCQFGAMFFPDKVRAFSEARRVLRPGGMFMFNVWDRLEENEFTWVVTEALATVFPEDPPQFMRRIPHGYFDTALIERHLRDAGFESPRFETVAARSRAATASEPAMALCQGTPLRSEIEARGGVGLAQATSACADALEARFGAGPVDGRIQAHVVCAYRLE